MPAYTDHTVGSRTKLLLCGDSGSGKTSSLASLANAGYNLRILDFDAGLDVLGNYLEGDAASRIHYVTLRDSMKTATAFENATKLITLGWKDGDIDLGLAKDWGDTDVLVIDSLTFLANSAMRRILQRDGKKFTDQPAIQHWGEAGRNIELLIQWLTSDELPCNLVVTTHVQYYDEPGGGSRAYPVALGRKLPTIIGRYFNTVLRIDVKPSKLGGSRILRTASDYKMDLKNPAPKQIDPEVDLDLNLIFEGIRKRASFNGPAGLVRELKSTNQKKE
jgi:hypothetical protein